MRRVETLGAVLGIHGIVPSTRGVVLLGRRWSCPPYACLGVPFAMAMLGWPAWRLDRATVAHFMLRALEEVRTHADNS